MRAIGAHGHSLQAASEAVGGAAVIRMIVSPCLRPGVHGDEGIVMQAQEGGWLGQGASEGWGGYGGLMLEGRPGGVLRMVRVCASVGRASVCMQS